MKYSSTAICGFLCFLCILGCPRKITKSDPTPAYPQKVIALSSSIAEMWLLAGGKLTGVSSDAFTERNFELPDTVVNVGGVLRANIELILANTPDLVLVSKDLSAHLSIAEVCDKLHIQTYTVKVETLPEYLTTLRDFSRLTGNDDAYYKNGVQVAERVDSMLARLKNTNTVNKDSKKTALVLRAYSGGVKTIGAEHPVCYILDTIGVRNIAAPENFTSIGNTKTALQDISLEKIVKANPDYIFVLLQGKQPM